MAHFLDNRGLPERALKIATDVDYRFELAVQLGLLDTALDIAQASESEAKWRQLGELALSSGKLDVRHSALLRMHVQKQKFAATPQIDPFLLLFNGPNLAMMNFEPASSCSLHKGLVEHLMPSKC